MKTYTLTNRGFACMITEIGATRSRRLNPRFNIRCHSPSGFAWGYEGSGPAQLALALLYDVVGDEPARQHYQNFKHEVIAKRDQDKPFKITDTEVLAWYKRINDTDGR